MESERVDGWRVSKGWVDNERESMWVVRWGQGGE